MITGDEVRSLRRTAVNIRADLMSLQEIRTEIAKLNPRDKALLAAELFASNDDIDDVELEAALQRGLDDVKAGRVRPVEKVKEMIARWTSKS